MKCLTKYLVFFVLMGCGFDGENGKNPTAQVTIELQNQSQSINPVLSSVPATVAGFSCLLVNITGSGIENKTWSTFTASETLDHCQASGVVSALIPLQSGSTSVQLMIPTGYQRKIQVLGIQASAGCDFTKGALDYIKAQTESSASIFELASKTTDIFSDTTVSLVNSYTASNPKEVRCTGYGSSILPNQISGLALWLRPEGLVGPVDDNPVTAWTEESGSSSPITFFPDSGAPLYSQSDSTLNNYPVAKFLGAGAPYIDKLLLTAQAGSGTIIAVAKRPASANGSDGAIIGVSGTAPSSSGWSLLLYDDSTNNGSKVKYGHYYSSAQYDSVEAIAIPNTESFKVITLTREYTASGFTVKIYINGTLWNTGTLSLANFTTPTAPTTTFIGANSSSGERLKGMIGELIVYEKLLTNTQRQQLECKLSKKYNITVTGPCF